MQRVTERSSNSSITACRVPRETSQHVVPALMYHAACWSRFMRPKAAAADGAAASPAKSAGGPRYQLAPSPPQTKLLTAKQAQGGLHHTGAAQRQPHRLFAGGACEAATSHAAQSEGAGDPPAQLQSLQPAPDADPIALWSARLHSSPQHGSQSEQHVAPQNDAASARAQDLQHASNGATDHPSSQGCGQGQTDGRAAAAAQAELSPATQSAAVQSSEPAAMLATDDRQQATAGTAAATETGQNGGWMPSSMDQVSENKVPRCLFVSTVCCWFCPSRT